jgi:hypothetical protein
VKSEWLASHVDSPFHRTALLSPCTVPPGGRTDERGNRRTMMDTDVVKASGVKMIKAVGKREIKDI